MTDKLVELLRSPRDIAAQAGRDGGSIPPTLESTDATARSAKALGINPNDIDKPAYLRNEGALQRLAKRFFDRWKKIPPPDPTI